MLNNLEFKIHDLDYSNSHTLDEALVSSADGAIDGGGAYAFVSVKGSELYLGDDAFLRFINNGRFRLIVGIDQITDANALGYLKAFSDKYEKFAVSAYLNTNSHSIFHPKFSWFRNSEGGVLVIGSGNLTFRGLRRNTESFVVARLDSDGIDAIEKEWISWLDQVNSFLLPVDDENVLSLAEQNQKVSTMLRINKIHPESITEKEEKLGLSQEVSDEETTALDIDDFDWTFGEEASVLITEIPKAGDRWNQANFTKDDFEEFFGAIAGDNSQRILLRSASDDGTLQEIEIRPSITVISHNFRFELEAAAGLSYPRGGRPIGVFIKISTRMFLYVLCMPESAFYAEVQSFLNSNISEKQRANRMKRIRTNIESLQESCLELPIWHLYHATK